MGYNVTRLVCDNVALCIRSDAPASFAGSFRGSAVAEKLPELARRGFFSQVGMAMVTLPASTAGPAMPVLG